MNEARRPAVLIVVTVTDVDTDAIGLDDIYTGSFNCRWPPKLQVFNTALMTAQSGYTFKEAKADREYWGHLVESAVGAYLVNAAAAGDCEVFYWRERGVEVDFIVRSGRTLTALEVKSGRVSAALSGLEVFSDAFRPKRRLLVDGDGIALESFLSRTVEFWTKQPPKA